MSLLTTHLLDFYILSCRNIEQPGTDQTPLKVDCNNIIPLFLSCFHVAMTSQIFFPVAMVASQILYGLICFLMICLHSHVSAFPLCLHPYFSLQFFMCDLSSHFSSHSRCYLEEWHVTLIYEADFVPLYIQGLQRNRLVLLKKCHHWT